MRYFRDVKKSALVHEVDKHTIWHDAAHDRFIYIANFRYVSNGFNTLFRSLQSFSIGAGDIDNTLIINLFDIDNRTGRRLNILNDLSTRANHSTDLTLLDHHFQDTRSVRLQIRSWFRNGFFHFGKNMQPALTR